MYICHKVCFYLRKYCTYICIIERYIDGCNVERYYVLILKVTIIQ